MYRTYSKINASMKLNIYDILYAYQNIHYFISPFVLVNSISNRLKYYRNDIKPLSIKQPYQWGHDWQVS